MIKTRRALVAIMASASVVLTACSGGTEGSSDTNSNSATSSSAESATENSAAESITIEDNYGEKTINYPLNTIVATDNRTLEVLADWGVELAAAPLPLIPPSIDAYYKNDSIKDLGTHREPDLDVIAGLQPDLVVNGQRFAQYYDDISSLVADGTVIELDPRITRVEKDKKIEGEAPLADELIRQVETLGKVFQKEEEAQKLVDDFNSAIERAKKAYNGEDTVMAINVSGGEIGYIAPTVGRTFGPIFDLLGLKPAIETDAGTSDHQGDDVSVEAIAQSNPTWIFVMDRDAATSSRTEDAFQPAQKVLENNPVLSKADAFSEQRVVYAPWDTYTNESIITYTEILNSIADAFESGKGSAQGEIPTDK